MNTRTVLPESYKEILHVDLQKNKKQMLIVNGIALVITAVMLPIGFLVTPIWSLYDNFAQLIVLVLGTILYILLHEIVHGICMKHFSGEKPFYGFTGLYAYAGSNAYFCRKDYVIIALAPVVLWGIVLLVMNLLLGETYFWVIYFIQILNISGAGGDFYVSWKFSKMPKDILINDIGVSMTVYAKESH